MADDDSTMPVKQRRKTHRRSSNFLFVAALSLASILLLSSVIVAVPIALPAAAAGEDNGGEKFEIQEATIEDIQNAIKSGEITATELVHKYLERIKAYNGVCVNEPEGILGPVSAIPNAGQLNALMTLNLRPDAREEWGFDDRKARSMTDLVDDDPNMPDALEVAAALDAEFAKTGELVGPLHGVVIALKDQYDTFDMRTTQGADALFANDRPPNDATFIAKLREAGAIIIAKANMGEYASGDRSSFGGVTCNPYDTERSPGRSSGGSGAAVAANLVTCAIGEESGGSTVNPARHNNIVGFPAPVELVSRDGMYSAEPVINDRVGPMCRTVEDVARVLTVIAGYDPKDPITAFSIGRMPSEPYESFTEVDEDGLEGIRIGVVREYMNKDLFTVADHETIDIIDQAIGDLEDLGATIVDPGEGRALFQECINKHIASIDNKQFISQFPDVFPVDASGNATADHISTLIDMYFDPSLVPHTSSGQPNIIGLGPAPSLGTAKYKMDWYLRERGDANIQSTADLIEKSNFFTDIRPGSGFSDKKESLTNTNNAQTLDNVNTLARHYVLQYIALQCFAENDLDAVIHPTTNIPAPKLGAPVEPTINGRSHLAWNLLPGTASFPVMAVPAGFTTHVFDRDADLNLMEPIPAKLPVGISFLGKPFDEPMLFKIASAYEAATHHRIPPPDFSGPLSDDESFPITHMSNTTASAGYGVYAQKPARAEYVTEYSELVGDSIDSITLRMKSVGTINGTAEIGILNEDLSVKKLFGTLDVDTLTPTYTDYEFSLTEGDELYQIEEGDRIGIKYEGGGFDETSWVSVMLDLDAEDPFDGANSYLQYHHQGSWQHSPDRDMYMVLKQTASGDDDGGAPPPPPPPPKTTFTAQLDGDQEVPPTDTTATGSAVFMLNDNKTALQYQLNVTSIYNVTAAHIHVAPAGVNGPVVVPLFSGNETGPVNGVLAEGTITSADDLTGPLAGMTMDDLIAEINEGNTYTNVHTSKYPGGEIRGQIS